MGEVSQTTGSEAVQSPRRTILDALDGPKRHFTPLYVLVVFMLVFEGILGFALSQLSGYERIAVLVPMILIPFCVLGGFLWIIIFRPEHLYSPSEYGTITEARDFIAALRGPRGSITTAEIKTSTMVAEVQASAVSESFTDGDAHDVLSLPATSAAQATGWWEVLHENENPSEADLEKAEEMFRRSLSETLGIEDRIESELSYLQVLLTMGDETAFERLGSLAEQAQPYPKVAAAAQMALGYANLVAGSPHRAERHYRQAETLAVDPLQKANAAGLVALSLARQEKNEAAVVHLQATISAAADDDSLAALYRNLAAMFELAKDYLHQAIALEKALEHAPIDTTMRFSAGLAYGAAGLDALALRHYLKVLDVSPAHAATLNNAGVQYVELEMPIHAVESYKNAQRRGQTLAAANLAHLYLKAGFADDAMRVLQEAQTHPDPDPGVPHAIAAILQRKEQEKGTQEAAMTKAVKQRLFILGYAEGRFALRSGDELFRGLWHSDDGHDVAIDQRQGEIEAIWDEGNLRYKLKASGGDRAAVVQSIKYESPTNIWISGTTADGGLMYMAQDSQSIEVMALKDGEASFFKFRLMAVPPTSPAAIPQTSSK